MDRRLTEHATFDIERLYDASPARVFHALSNQAAKATWFGSENLALDFTVGGREHFTAAMPDGRTFGYNAYFQEIVPNERIIYAYTVDFDQIRISVSLSTVEITPAGEKTRFLYTEQTVYLDGGDTPADRERGTHEEFDRLALALAPAEE